MKIKVGLILCTAMTVIGLIATIAATTPHDRIEAFAPTVLFGVAAFILFLMRNRGRVGLTQYNPYVDVSLYETPGASPEVQYSALRLREGERIIFASPALTFTNVERVTGYTSSSAGISYRLTGNLSVHSGRSQSAPIRKTMQKYNRGDYIVTNKRILFIGMNDRFEYPVSKVSTARFIARDAFILMAGNSSRNIVVHQKQIKYAMACTQYVIK